MIVTLLVNTARTRVTLMEGDLRKLKLASLVLKVETVSLTFCIQIYMLPHHLLRQLKVHGSDHTLPKSRTSSDFLISGQ